MDTYTEMCMDIGFDTDKKQEVKPITKAPRADHQKEIIKLIKQVAYNKAVYQVFNDFLEMSAISLSNQVDFTHRDEREKRYLDIIKTYDKKHQQLFPLMFFHLVEALEEKAQTTGPEDVLGPIYHELELHNKYKAQFFTPQPISDFMAYSAIGNETQAAIEEKGFISVCEPAVGSGVMVTSICKAMKSEGLNYCTQLVVTAVDCDLKCAHMTYIQLSLYGIPAVVIHGDSLSCKEWSRWYTPVYMLNGWIWRGHCGITSKSCVEDEMIKCALEPSYAIIMKLKSLFAGNAPDNASEPETATLKEETEPDNPHTKATQKRNKQKSEPLENATHLSLFG